MGRVKLQIKKIENTTNRQVTFSKRRNGIIKKAYELSVLCDVDVALILFSPSGRVTTFSANRTIEEVMERYMNLPEHERGRLHNEEYLQRTLGKLKSEIEQTNQAGASPHYVDYQLEEIQKEIFRYKSELEEVERRLRVFEGDPYQITTLYEAEYRERMLEETLKHVRLQKRILEDQEYNSTETQSTSQVQVQIPQEALNMNVLSTTTNTNMLDWVPQRDPQVQILNFLGSNGLLSIRDEGEAIEDMLPQTLSMSSSCGQNINMQVINEPTSTSTCGNGMHNHHQQHHHHHHHQGAVAAAADHTEGRPHFEQVIDVNISPWTQFYPPGSESFSSSHPRERGLLELFLSQFTP